MLSEIEKFIQWVRMRSPQAKTWQDYKCDMGLFLAVVGDRNAGEIHSQDVDRFVSYQVEQGYKPSTINRRLAAVVSFYRYLIAEGKALTCPVLPKRHSLRQLQRLPRPVKEQDLHRFFSAVQGLRDRAMFTLMLRCGLRIGEVAALEMTDLYLDEAPSCLIVRGKGSRERTVYLSPETGNILKHWLAHRAAVRDRHVFLSYQDRKLSTTSISKRIKSVSRASGVDLTAHRLRHTFADHLLSAGVPITSIQKLMGHRFVETTQNYARANDKQVQADFYEACEKLDGWKLLAQAATDPDLGIVLREHGEHSQETGGLNPPGDGVPPRILRLPAELAGQLQAYCRLKASRWRLERVAANRLGFYSLHGRMWEFFCRSCGLHTVSELQMNHVLQYIQSRLDAGRSARTVNGSLSSLRSFLTFLKEDQVNIHPSLDNIQRLKETDQLPRYISPGQVLRLRKEMDEEVQRPGSVQKQNDAVLLRAIFYLLWQAGLRSGEVVMLRFSDFYLSQAGREKKLLIRDGKWRKGRAVYLTDTALEALKAYLAVRGVRNATDFVFVRNGLPLKKDFLARHLRAVGRQVDVSVSPHRLRHTFATQLLNVGCRVTSIQKLLGHTNLNTTMIYARAFDQTVMRDYFQAVDAMEGQEGGAWFGLNEISSPE